MAEAEEMVDEDKDYAFCQSISMGKEGRGTQKDKLTA